MRVVVAGGGIAGLAAARAFAIRGHTVRLVERSSRLGGKIVTEGASGFVWEAGPDSFVATKPGAVDLCRALDLDGELIAPLAGDARVWGSAGLVPLPAGVRIVPTRFRPLFESPLFDRREAFRAAADRVLPGRSPAGDESLAGLIDRRMGRAVLDRLVAPLVAGIHAADPGRLSVRATFPALAEAERETGSLMRGMAARPRPEGPTFMTLAPGLALLVRRLEEVLELLGATLVTGVAVTRLEPSRSGWSVHLDGGGPLSADAVVLAVPAFRAAPLVDGFAPAAAEELASIDHVSTAVVTLGYRPPGAPRPSGHGFVVARDRPARISGATFVSSKWPGRAPRGGALVRVYLGSAVAPVDLEADDATLAALALEDLERAAGIDARPSFVRVHRWPRAMPQYVVGHLDRMTRIESELAERGGIALGGASYRGSGIADCIVQGEAAAARLCGERPETRLQDPLRADVTSST